jgi:hypothetical protein
LNLPALQNEVRSLSRYIYKEDSDFTFMVSSPVHAHRFFTNFVKPLTVWANAHPAVHEAQWCREEANNVFVSLSHSSLSYAELDRFEHRWGTLVARLSIAEQQATRRQRESGADLTNKGKEAKVTATVDLVADALGRAHFVIPKKRATWRKQAVNALSKAAAEAQAAFDADETNESAQTTARRLKAIKPSWLSKHIDELRTRLDQSAAKEK